MNSEDQVLLGVNVDHVATLRQARGTDYPQPVEAAMMCMQAGAVGITVHLREDRRHIQDADVYAIRALKNTPLNLEMGAAEEVIRIALDVCPEEVCLVPEKRQELTTEGGLDVAGNMEHLQQTVQRMAEKKIRVSMFIDPDRRQIDAAADAGAPVIELHTGAFCDAPADRRQAELEALIDGAVYAQSLGLQVNAGHGIALDTIGEIMTIPYLHTLNIGHSIVARAVFVGLDQAVKEMMSAMSAYRES